MMRMLFIMRNRKKTHHIFISRTLFGDSNNNRKRKSQTKKKKPFPTRRERSTSVSAFIQMLRNGEPKRSTNS